MLKKIRKKRTRDFTKQQAGMFFRFSEFLEVIGTGRASAGLRTPPGMGYN